MKMKVDRWYRHTEGNADRFSWRVWCPVCKIDGFFESWKQAWGITNIHLAQHRRYDR